MMCYLGTYSLRRLLVSTAVTCVLSSAKRLRFVYFFCYFCTCTPVSSPTWSTDHQHLLETNNRVNCFIALRSLFWLKETMKYFVTMSTSRGSVAICFSAFVLTVVSSKCELGCSLAAVMQKVWMLTIALALHSACSITGVSQELTHHRGYPHSSKWELLLHSCDVNMDDFRWVDVAIYITFLYYFTN